MHSDTTRQDTREKILERGAELVHSRGFNNTGLKDILEAAGVPKGSFYFYFKNKEAFGLELVQYHVQRLRTLLAPILDNESQNPRDRLVDFFTWFRDVYSASDYRKGCPIGNLCLEMSDLSPDFQQALSQAMDGMARRLAEIIVQGQEQGCISAVHSPRELADFLLASWQGATLLMKTHKSIEPFDRLLRYVETLLDIPARA